ncbi:PQ-loop-domain-containing protein [Cristinia sonorae]|uniref:PQ-loop-domain-containing protein n=1 Tax=Cristinia sonorae TaxID=1940300 RepID=A0A8K0UVW3_9AGAR|nr:PQ-loop-domain-containing protein [Cristinia sonorae]
MIEGHESLSSILGWMSIACWIVVYSPQIWENYELQSGEGLSVLFVLIWLAGDLANLFGAMLAGLLPTIIILGAYYTVCDLTLLGQVYYYRWKNSRQAVPTLVPDVSLPAGTASENTPLIASVDPIDRDQRPSLAKQFIKYAFAVLFVLSTGVAAWAIDQHIHKGQPRTRPEEVVEWKSQLLGWFSAVMFLGARVPQILKNLQTKCEGLSPALFLFSIAGNTTYALSILAASMEYRHLVANAAWLAGSLLTVFLDIFVLLQFFYYRTVDRPLASGASLS